MPLKGAVFVLSKNVIDSNIEIRMKIIQFGGIVEDSISPNTTHVISSHDSLLSTEVQLASSKKIPVVSSDFISACIEKDSLLNLNLQSNFNFLLKLDAELPVDNDQDQLIIKLMKAVKENNFELLKLVLELDRDKTLILHTVDGFNFVGDWTALHWAAYKGHDGMVVALLMAGADPLALDSDGWTALHLATYRNKVSCVNLLAKGAALEAQDIQGCTALHISAKWGHKDCMAALIGAGASLHTKNKLGWTALYVATTEGKRACVAELKKAQRTLDGKSADVAKTVQTEYRKAKIDAIESIRSPPSARAEKSLPVEYSTSSQQEDSDSAELNYACEKEEFNMNHAQQSTNQMEEDLKAKCRVCFNGKFHKTNNIVFCENCNIAVHQHCYGSYDLPVGDWFCRPCYKHLYDNIPEVIENCQNAENCRFTDLVESTPEIQKVKLAQPVPFCLICPFQGGAYLWADQEPKGWVHVNCAKLARLTINPTTSHVTGVSELQKQNAQQQCCKCHKKGGALLNCTEENCPNFFHFFCALDERWDLSQPVTGSSWFQPLGVPENPHEQGALEWSGLCGEHSSTRASRKFASKPANWRQRNKDQWDGWSNCHVCKIRKPLTIRCKQGKRLQKKTGLMGTCWLSYCHRCVQIQGENFEEAFDNSLWTCYACRSKCRCAECKRISSFLSPTKQKVPQSTKTETANKKELMDGQDVEDTEILFTQNQMRHDNSSYAFHVLSPSAPSYSSPPKKHMRDQTLPQAITHSLQNTKKTKLTKTNDEEATTSLWQPAARMHLDVSSGRLSGFSYIVELAICPPTTGSRTNLAVCWLGQGDHSRDDFINIWTDPTVAFLHAELELKHDGEIYLKDNDSQSGTVWNGSVLSPGCAKKLTTGDTFSVGQTSFCVHSINCTPSVNNYVDGEGHKDVGSSLQPAASVHLKIFTGPLSGFSRFVDLALAPPTTGKRTNLAVCWFGRGDHSRDDFVNIWTDPTVAFLHAKLELKQDGAIYLSDNDSQSGTEWNGMVLTPGSSKKLEIGDTFTVGQTSFLVCTITCTSDASIRSFADKQDGRIFVEDIAQLSQAQGNATNNTKSLQAEIYQTMPSKLLPEHQASTSLQTQDTSLPRESQGNIKSDMQMVLEVFPDILPAYVCEQFASKSPQELTTLWNELLDSQNYPKNSKKKELDADSLPA